MGDFLNFELFAVDENVFRVVNLLYILLIVTVARLITWTVRSIVKRRLGKLKDVDRGRRYAIVSITRYFVYTLAIILILQASGVNITVLIAGSTALFVGLGLGLQNTFNDIVSGVILLFEGSLEIGDVVEQNGVIGRVIKIGLRTSTIISRDDVAIIVPNSRFVSDEVVNLTHQKSLVRLHLTVGVAYGSDVNLVRELLIKVAAAHPAVVEDPAPKVLFQDFGDSALQFDLLLWTYLSFEAEFTLSDLRFAVDQAFRENAVRIPFPQRDVHLYPPPPPGDSPSSESP
ncbi:MAG: mechanosensitive ion channel domain-containing protein [Bacteroidota bacterium]